jgi:hypothetical protein
MSIKFPNFYKQYPAAKDVKFVMVNLGYLASDDRLLKMLADRGYKIE